MTQNNTATINNAYLIAKAMVDKLGQGKEALRNATTHLTGAVSDDILAALSKLSAVVNAEHSTMQGKLRQLTQVLTTGHIPAQPKDEVQAPAPAPVAAKTVTPPTAPAKKGKAPVDKAQQAILRTVCGMVVKDDPAALEFIKAKGISTARLSPEQIANAMLGAGFVLPAKDAKKPTPAPAPKADPKPAPAPAPKQVVAPTAAPVAPASKRTNKVDVLPMQDFLALGRMERAKLFTSLTDEKQAMLLEAVAVKMAN